MFILYTKINNEQKRTKKPKSGVQYEHIEHNVHSGHPASNMFMIYCKKCFRLISLIVIHMVLCKYNINKIITKLRYRFWQGRADEGWVLPSSC